jgi:hypothetical protein
MYFNASAKSFLDWACVITFKFADGGLELPVFLTQVKKLISSTF